MASTDRPVELVLPGAVRDALLAHARESAPEEVCGILVGHRGSAVESAAGDGASADAPGDENVDGANVDGENADADDENADADDENTDADYENASVDHENAGVDDANAGAECENVDVVTDHRPVENVADRPRTRYELDPAETVETIERVEAAGDDVVGFYHSHPRGPLAPSETDHRRATWRGYVYAIVAPDEGVRAWRWTGEAFVELSVGD